MAQKDRPFRGNRHNPYNNKPWRERHGRDGRDDRSFMPKSDTFTEVKPREDTINDRDHNESGDKDCDKVSAPIDAMEKGRREKKFGNRARLYVGNLPRGVTEEELRTLFNQFGETEQVFIEKEKNFGFVRMAYRSEGERAIAALNNEEYKGRELRVRFAASSCSVKVHNLHATVSNELLARAFSHFGEVEFATVMTDDRGKSLGYGVVDFVKKAQAMMAMERCNTGCFLLTRSPIPVYVTEFKRENEEGLPEKQMQNNRDFNFERETPPRMAIPGSPEFDFALRWKTLYEAEENVKKEVDMKLKEQRTILETDTDNFHHHEHAATIRQQLLEHQREQMRLEERLRQHELFLKHPQLQGGSGMLPPPPPMGMPGGLMGLPPPPQPLLADRLGEEIRSDRNNSTELHSGGSLTDTGNGGLITAGMQFLLQQSGMHFPK